MGGLLAQQYFLQVIPKAEITLFATEKNQNDKPYGYNGTNSAFTVRTGTLVQVTLFNTGVVMHDFVIDDLAVHLLPDVEPSHSGTVTFLASRAGTYTYFCSIPGHKELGMQGQLTILG